ncbi:MAG: hypothetical protein ACTSRF_13790, partial [Candidatus Freyarchaeota archaeon]
MERKDELEEFLDTPTGVWLTAENVRDGQMIEVVSVQVDRENYDKPRVVVSGVDENGDEVLVSMGRQ